MSPILLFFIILVFVVVLLLMPMLGKRSTPDQFWLTMGLSFFLPGALLFFLGLHISTSILIAVGAFICLVGLGFLFPVLRKLITRLSLRRNGVRCDAIVLGFAENEQLGATKTVTTPISFSYWEYHPKQYLCEGDSHRFTFYFPPAWNRHDQMLGLRVTVVYDPSRPSRYYVDRKSIRKVWKGKNQ